MYYSRVDINRVDTVTFNADIELVSSKCAMFGYFVTSLTDNVSYILNSSMRFLTFTSSSLMAWMALFE